MDLDRLRLFLRIVDLGSMSAAARDVHLTQPALSHALRQLEEEVAADLFDRRGRGLVLTAAGRALVPRARALLEASERTRLEVRRSAQRDYFDVRLGSVDSVATFLMPHLVDPLSQAFPDLAIKFATARTAVLLERARVGAIDLAVVAHSGPPPGLRHVRIGGYRLQYFGARDRFADLARATTTEEVRRFPVVEIEPAPGTNAFDADEARSYAVVSNVATVKALVMAGFGVGDLPDFMLTPNEAARLVGASVPHDPDCALFLVSANHWQGENEQRMERLIADKLRAALGQPPPAPAARRRRG
jgi:DNA-binding transcriptional LysR family regulator